MEKSETAGAIFLSPERAHGAVGDRRADGTVRCALGQQLSRKKRSARRRGPAGGPGLAVCDLEVRQRPSGGRTGPIASPVDTRRADRRLDGRNRSTRGMSAGQPSGGTRLHR